MQELWTKVKTSIKEKIPPHSFRMWIETIWVHEEKDSGIVLACPNSFCKDWVHKNYGRLIQSEIDSIAGASFDFSIIISKKTKTNKQTKHSQSIVKEKCDAQNNTDNKIGAASHIIKSQQIKGNHTKNIGGAQINGQMHLPGFSPFQGRVLRQGYTFDHFVVGKCNEFAYEASMSLASNKTTQNSALFLSAKTGLGKSHLSQAIGHHILNSFNNKRVYYVTAEDFANEMIQSIHTKTMHQFKEKYRKLCDVFILEDIHFLSGKTHTQDELSFTLDILQESGKKIIYTSSYYPNEIPKMQDNLGSRLSSGIISQLDAPDYETRFRILQKKAMFKGLVLPEEVNHFLAAELTKDVRQLESGLIGVMARASLLNKPINIKLAEEVLQSVKQPKEVTIDTIIKLICQFYNVTREELVSQSRKKAIAHPRQMGIYLCRKFTDHSLQLIGKSFRRHHATIFHSVTTIEKKVKGAGLIKKQVEYLCDQIEAIKA